MFGELNEIKTLIISGKECCKEDTDCQNDEQCSGGNCISACDLVTCRQNANCIAENHKVKCECQEGYSRVGSNECQKGKTQNVCSNFL